MEVLAAWNRQRVAPPGSTVASQHECRSGPPVPGAMVTPSSSRPAIAPQSSSGVEYISARFFASMPY